MRKSGIFILGAALSFTFLFHTKEILRANAAEKGVPVYVGGMSAGFTLQSGNVQIMGICEVISENGIYSPAAKAGFRTGDRIIKVNGVQVETVSQLNKLVNVGNGKALEIEAERGMEDTYTGTVTPLKDKVSNIYKIGILARDNVSGIGTITYIQKDNGKFGALGHPVTNCQNKELKICNGSVYSCSIIGVNKGVRCHAGELKGIFLNDKTFGSAEKLCNSGIFGQISQDFEYKNRKQALATSSSAVPGKAYIYSTVDGECPQKYEIEVVKVDKFSKDNKNYVVKITDEALIEETGGIVQGMSGSPIIQNDKLIGAITHVFLNDPTRGYGIDIETMLAE